MLWTHTKTHGQAASNGPSASSEINSFVHDGKSVKCIGGARKLTPKSILRIQGHYGAAIRNNAGDVHAMKSCMGDMEAPIWGPF